MDAVPEYNPIKGEFQDVSFSIILINTENRGNIGSIARIMKNFGFFDLILVNPMQNHLDNYAQGFAMKAKDILKSAEVIRCAEDDIITLKKLFQRFDIVIGTSAKGFRSQNIKRIPVFLEDLDLTQIPIGAKDIKGAKGTKIALVFGRESTGLSNEQVKLTDFLIKIAASPSYPTLNLSHAVGIVLASIYRRMHHIERIQVEPATKSEKDNLISIVEKIINQAPLQGFRKDRTLQAFKNLVGRAFISKKEQSLIFNLFRKIGMVFEHPELARQMQDRNVEENSKNL
ncbi:MAG: RNA methyltransferase [Promethearchaeota archaeon]